MSTLQRVTQWNAFTRVWHLFDAKWQNPFDSAKIITKYLKGTYKPFYHPLNRCGDMVVVINSKDVALPGDEWRKRVYFHHTGYPGGATWTLAWELHEKDPTMVIYKAVYRSMKGNLQRRYTMKQLLIYPDDKVPEDIMGNITNQIRGLRPVPKTLPSYGESAKDFPRIWTPPKDYMPK
ncbi:39S ribosomal protein L13, mitochondrial [Cimex lectularius]|uniref:39S ribosomal protein L13, mitochondrial n=1 Tax=Cimex lectularius TaxID=79782 RepID=A0A8I6RT17_CIMLE|nr:39S ribosomal protein L13, mitochondrial [Cimex lectularius]XP_014250878.1 39S ribosomal protein L13, mitochondrial [Cimex lectularius]